MQAGAADLSIWEWVSEDRPTDLDAMRAIIDRAIEPRQRGERIALAIIDKETGGPVGSTSFLDIRPADGNIEIGWTWHVPSVQRTSVNTECKLMLLTCAFESLGMRRVCLKTDRFNERSRRAIMRLGASFEGIIRSHVWVTGVNGGRLRDSAYYSILDSEWPDVKRALESRLASGVR